jgi:diketogulonate reductase-like aldo/keto reductase
MTLNNALPLIPLNDGTQLPAQGFGTYKLNGSKGVTSLKRALATGYSLLDSAVNYENEGAVGEAVRRSQTPREAVQVTSKLPGRHHRFEQALDCIEESLFRTRLDYFDLYLIHWPNPSQGLYTEAWSALIEARARGWIKSIGVCNFLPEHLETIIDATGVKPSVNQIELHPYFPQHQQLAWHQAHGIATQSWSPLGRANDLLKDPVLQRIADEIDKSVAQVILRWHHQLGAIALPKASSVERQTENLSVFDFELTPVHLESIAGLAKVDGRTFDQNPAYHEEF